MQVTPAAEGFSLYPPSLHPPRILSDVQTATVLKCHPSCCGTGPWLRRWASYTSGVGDWFWNRWHCDELLKDKLIHCNSWAYECCLSICVHAYLSDSWVRKVAIDLFDDSWRFCLSTKQYNRQHGLTEWHWMKTSLFDNEKCILPQNKQQEDS